MDGKEKLKLAKEALESGSYDKDTIEYIFPELKESRDEMTKNEIITFVEQAIHHGSGTPVPQEMENKWIAWLEKQSNRTIDSSKNYQDDKPNGGIVLEDFNGSEGFYKLNLDYLNRKQVEEIEEIVRGWNKDSKAYNEKIKACIGMCLTDANEQRFKDYNTSLKDCLLWLEKQGVKTNPYSGVSFEYNGHIWGMCARDNGVDILLDKQLFKHLEKQDEQENLCDKCRKEHPSHSCQDITALGMCAVEHDKVEPRFHKGDWIVFNGLTLLIEEVLQGWYRTVSIGGIHNSYDWSIDNTARIWTLQNEAKDGDVLVCEDEEYLLFKSFSNTDMKIKLYCWYNCQTSNFHLSVDLKLRQDANIYPATKEQRDTLMKAMTDAGYIFDVERKELKKIEQKSALCEDDERERKRIIGLLEGWSSTFKETCYAEDCKCGIVWLESLKYRYTWKPSEKQLDALEHFVRSVGESGYSSPYDQNTKLLYSLLTDLQVLKQQGEQKPFNYENCNIKQKDFAPKSTMEAIEEKVDEANFADDKKADVVKPIFKVGDEVYNMFDKSLAHVVIEYVDETTYYGDTTNFDIIDQDQWGIVRSCENCKCGHYDYPAVSCYLHEDCGGDEPIIIHDDDFVETAMNCKEFEQEN